MCARWYERCGDYRPWHSESVPGCTCGLNAHYPGSAHAQGCPVRDQHDRAALLGQLTGRSPAPSPGP
jgi:hypothetical protein